MSSNELKFSDSMRKALGVAVALQHSTHTFRPGKLSLSFMVIEKCVGGSMEDASFAGMDVKKRVVEVHFIDDDPQTIPQDRRAVMFIHLSESDPGEWLVVKVFFQTTENSRQEPVQGFESMLSPNVICACKVFPEAEELSD